jgi:hypothetical protein
MTGTEAGRWIAVPLRDGSTRYDWLPDEQPPSPDGTPGRWHVVGAPGGEGHWEWCESQPGEAPAMPFSLRPYLMAYRSAIVSVVAVVALLAAVIVTFAGGDGADPAPSAQSAPTAPPDLEFPKRSGPWTLYSVTVERVRSTKTFAGRATVGYTGPGPASAPRRLVLHVVRGGRIVGELTGTIGRLERGGYTTVALSSKDAWVADPDGFVFRTE